MRSWPGTTVFDMDWRGNYGAFGFFDQYDAGPFGPISSCYKYTAY